MLDDETCSELAAELHEALESAEPVEPLTDRYDLTVEDAYRVQNQLIDRRVSGGAEVVGHKIGLTSEAIQDQFGVNEPDFGHLLDTMMITGNTIPTQSLIEPMFEAEIGFLLGEDLEGDVNYLDVLSATRAVVPLIEVIDSRVRDWDIELQDTVADNASSAFFAIGDQIYDVRDRDLTLESVKILVDGELEVTGVGANVLGHPARAVAWLANKVGEMEDTLEAGELVLSGASTESIGLEPGTVIDVKFSSLGSMTYRVE
ncbi:MAG: fumarylacetoacetate hydrolase family protein [Halobacteria archaeon]|nr:fumarylacetoacetate hydrolase family protein [Halobacteria archaeon]